MMRWYFLMGAVCFLLFLHHAMTKPKNPEWNKMIDPFSKQAQAMIALTCMLYAFVWPVMLVIMLVDEWRKG